MTTKGTSTIPGAGPGELGIVPDPFTRWCGIKNIARVTMEGEKIWALLDMGCQVNMLTPRFVEAHGLEVQPLLDLAEGKGPHIIGIGGTAVRPLGYMIVNLQVEAAGSYNKDQIALVIPDASAFTARAPMIIGTCTLNRIVEAMKESELDHLTLQWELIQYSRDLVAHTGRVTWKTVRVTCQAGTVEGADEVLHAYDGELLEPYATHQIKAKLKARATHQGQYVLIHSLE